MNEMEREIDAVMVATPDHTHAVAAMAAIERGKHLYCEKPLAHSIYEVRQLMDAARKHKRIVQVGAQQRSGEHYIQAVKLIQEGALGEVHKVSANCIVNASLECDLKFCPNAIRRCDEYRLRHLWKSCGKHPAKAADLREGAVLYIECNRSHRSQGRGTPGKRRGAGTGRGSRRTGGVTAGVGEQRG